MSKFSLNYQDLNATVDHLDKKFFKLSEVKDKLVKVAFDVFKMQGQDPDDLWQIQSADDGEYIVAKYDLDEPKEIKTSGNWSTLIDKSGSLNVFYKNHPITKIAAKTDEATTLQSFLPNKLASDKGFVQALLNSLPNKESVLKTFPELGK